MVASGRVKEVSAGGRWQISSSPACGGQDWEGRRSQAYLSGGASDSAFAKAAAKGKAAAKAKAAPNPPPKGWEASWCKQIGDKEACVRYAIGKCTKYDCKFVHGCPVPLPSGKAPR